MNLYIKPFFATKKEREDARYAQMKQQYADEQRKLLAADMQRAREDMNAAYATFDYVTDPDLIDSSIYQVNAILKRYKYLKEQAEKLESPPARIMADALNKEASASVSVI